MKAVLATLALATLPMPASAAGCTATAEAPSAPSYYLVEARGAFSCDDRQSWIEVEVCLEALGTVAWEQVSCDTAYATDAKTVEGLTWGCRDGLHVLRTTASGRSGSGQAGWAASLPVAFYCSPI